MRLEGFKDKSIKNLLAGIESSKARPFENVLFAIGIRYVGKTVAEKLARYFKNIDNLSRATLDELMSAPEIGEKIAKSVFEFFRKQENQQEILRLKAAKLRLESDEKEPVKVSDTLAGKSFVISGT